jgi:hypothetical protein
MKSILIIALAIVFGIGIGLSLNVSAEEGLIPSWIKSTASFWVDGQIGDAEFLSALQFLVKEGILVIPDDTSSENIHSQVTQEQAISPSNVIENKYEGGSLTKFSYELTPSKDSAGNEFTWINMKYEFYNGEKTVKGISFKPICWKTDGDFVLGDENVAVFSEYVLPYEHVIVDHKTLRNQSVLQGEQIVNCELLKENHYVVSPPVYLENMNFKETLCSDGKLKGILTNNNSNDVKYWVEIRIYVGERIISVTPEEFYGPYTLSPSESHAIDLKFDGWSRAKSFSENQDLENLSCDVLFIKMK